MGTLIRNGAKCWLAAVLLGLTGLVLNFAKIELFFNVDMITGGVAVMLAVKYCGRRAVLSGFIASLATYFIWNHPYAIIIFTAEALFVSLFTAQDKDIIIADIWYWLCCGVFLVFIFYHVVMGLEIKPTLVIILKQSVNGVLAATVASIIYHVINILRKVSGHSYKSVSIRIIFFKILVIAAFLPAMVFIIMSVKADNDHMSQTMRNSLISFVKTARLSTDEFLNDIHGSELMIADTAASGGYVFNDGLKQRLDDEISKTLRTSGMFLGLGVIDNSYDSVSLYLKLDGKLVKQKKTNFSDRDYYSDVRGAGHMYISDVYDSLVKGVSRKMIVMLTPLRDKNGTIKGYIQGGIDFSQLNTTLKKLTESTGIYFTLADRHGKIISTTNPELKDADKYSDVRGTGSITVFKDGVYQWTPKPSENVTFMSRWMNSYYIMKSDITGSSGLSITAEYPLISYVEYMNNRGINSLLVIAIMIITIVLIAWFLSSRVASHITALSSNTAHLPEKIYQGEEIKWPGSLLTEVNVLEQNFSDMQHQLFAKFFQLKQKSTELRLIINSIPMIIFLKDTRNNVIMGNSVAGEFLGMAPDELRQKPVKDIFPDTYDKMYDDDLKVIKTGEAVRKIIQLYPMGDRNITVMTDKIPVLGQDGHVESILIISQDITDDIKAAEERQKTLDTLYQQSKMAEMGAMIGAIAHQWKQPLNTIAMVTQVMQSDAEDGTLDKSDILENTKLLMDNINFMSQTVTDFTGYFKQNKEKQLFRPCETIKEIYTLIDRQFIKNNIKVIFHEHEHFEMTSYRNEFKQVCLNVLNNAKDSLIESDRKDKRIDIRYKITDKDGMIIISDNGGGIAPELLPEKLFEPYHSTKGDKGTGIGLYICKNIMEQHIGGTITARNTKDGAEFTLTVPFDHA